MQADVALSCLVNIYTYFSVVFIVFARKVLFVAMSLASQSRLLSFPMQQLHRLLTHLLLPHLGPSPRLQSSGLERYSA